MPIFMKERSSKLHSNWMKWVFDNYDLQVFSWKHDKGKSSSQESSCSNTFLFILYGVNMILLKLLKSKVISYFDLLHISWLEFYFRTLIWPLLPRNVYKDQVKLEATLSLKYLKYWIYLIISNNITTIFCLHFCYTLLFT